MAEGVNVTRAIDSDSHAQLRVATRAADRGGNRLCDFAVCVELDDVVAIVVRDSYESAIG